MTQSKTILEMTLLVLLICQFVSFRNSEVRGWNLIEFCNSVLSHWGKAEELIVLLLPLAWTGLKIFSSRRSVISYLRSKYERFSLFYVFLHCFPFLRFIKLIYIFSELRNGLTYFPWRKFYPSAENQSLFTPFPLLQLCNLGRGYTILTSRELMWCYACVWDVRGDLILNSMAQIHTSVTLLTSRDFAWSCGRLMCQHASERRAGTWADQSSTRDSVT
jgi:hypothetical protein